jgi:hypothetical protein
VNGHPAGIDEIRLLIQRELTPASDSEQHTQNFDSVVSQSSKPLKYLVAVVQELGKERMVTSE